MTDPILVAEARAAAARARMSATLATLQARVAPKALAQDAVQGLREKGQAVAESGVEALRRNPLTAFGALAAAGLFFARKPLAKLLVRGANATPIAPESLTPRTLRAAKRKSK